MKRHGILNPALAQALASLGHGDLLMVVDAGFPIPADAHRIDLALVQDVPDLQTVLAVVHAELIVEAVVVAAEMEQNNPPLAAWLRQEFSGSEFELVPHAEVLTSVPRSAKAIVRTGAFNPWGNIGLRSGVDVSAWFADDRLIVPEDYRARLDDPARRAP